MKNKRILSLILCLVLVFVLGGEVLFSAFCVTASASERSYSNALDDLQKDSSFDTSQYPFVYNDYSLQVIQIAESEYDELFVYVYQPSDGLREYKAKYINMSLQSPYDDDENVEYSLYSLTWVNSNGVFDKYIVDGISVSDEDFRYYTIAGIYREYDGDVDDSSVAIDSIQYTSYEVGQAWCAYRLNGELVYEMETVEVVDVEIHATGSVRYSEGFKLYLSKCDSHYVAFSIENFNVDKIFDGKIKYTLKNWITNVDLSTGATIPQLMSSETHEKKLTELDTGSNAGDGLFGKKYTWNRIQDVDTFIEEAVNDANEEFDSEELAALSKADYVFRFCETDYEVLTSAYTQTTEYSTATEIGVLQMHFMAEGETYNLGCVSDLVGTDSDPELEVGVGDNITNTLEEFEDAEWYSKLLMILGLIVIGFFLMIFAQPLKFIFGIIVDAFKTVGKMLWNIISIPFKLLGELLSGK